MTKSGARGRIDPMAANQGVDAATDPLSELGRRVVNCNRGHAYGKLLAGEGDSAARQLLNGIGPERVLVGKIANHDLGMCVVGGLYLWHDCLSEGHAIAQGVAGPTCSFWHAIMHRREGDFANSKYWYARCAAHPAYPFIAMRVNSIVGPMLADNAMLRLTHNGWRPEAF